MGILPKGPKQPKGLAVSESAGRWWVVWERTREPPTLPLHQAHLMVKKHLYLFWCLVSFCLFNISQGMKQSHSPFCSWPSDQGDRNDHFYLEDHHEDYSVCPMSKPLFSTCANCTQGKSHSRINSLQSRITAYFRGSCVKWKCGSPCS